MQAPRSLQGPPAPGALGASRGNWELMSPAPPGAAYPSGEAAATPGILQFPRGPRATLATPVAVTREPALAASAMDRAREGSVSAWLPRGLASQELEDASLISFFWETGERNWVQSRGEVGKQLA